jgi:catalase
MPGAADTNYYSQPGNLFRLMSPAQRQALFENTARSAGGAPKEIQLRHTGSPVAWSGMTN